MKKFRDYIEEKDFPPLNEYLGEGVNVMTQTVWVQNLARAMGKNWSDHRVRGPKGIIRLAGRLIGISYAPPGENMIRFCLGSTGPVGVQVFGIPAYSDDGEEILKKVIYFDGDPLAVDGKNLNDLASLLKKAIKRGSKFEDVISFINYGSGDIQFEEITFDEKEIIHEAKRIRLADFETKWRAQTGKKNDQVSWNEIVAFADKLSVQVPTSLRNAIPERGSDMRSWSIAKGERKKPNLKAKPQEVKKEKGDLTKAKQVDSVPIIDEMRKTLNIHEFLREYEEMVRRTVRMTIKSKTSHVFTLTGEGGQGKTFSITDELKKYGRQDEDWIKITGGITGVALYMTLLKFRHGIILIDDADAAFDDREKLNMLKGALDSNEPRIVSRKTGATIDPPRGQSDAEREEGYEDIIDLLDSGDKKAKLPSRIRFDGKLIIITNYTMEEASKKLDAVRDRGWIFPYNLTKEELMVKIEDVIPKSFPELSSKQQEEVMFLIRKSVDEKMVVKFSMRLMGKAVDIITSDVPRKDWMKMIGVA